AAGTWLLAWLVWLFLLAFPSVSGGSQGLILPPKTLLGLDATPTVHFEVALVMLTLTALAIAAVRRGAPGLDLSALPPAPRAPAAGVAALGLIGLVSGPLARALQLPLERFDTAVAAILLVFVLALGGGGIVPWLRRFFPLQRRTARAGLVAERRERAQASAGPVLQAIELRKAFGGVVALDGLSVQLARGETVALVGATGSGKTT